MSDDTFYRGTLHWEEAIDNGMFQPKSRSFKPYSRMNILNGRMTVAQRQVVQNANRSQTDGGLYTTVHNQFRPHTYYVRNFRRTYERTTGWEEFKP